MKPSEYLKNKAGSMEMYWHTWGIDERIPKEMDKMFISKDEIRSRLAQHHKGECKGCIASPLVAEAEMVALTCPCSVCKELRFLLLEEI